MPRVVEELLLLTVGVGVDEPGGGMVEGLREGRTRGEPLDLRLKRMRLAGPCSCSCNRSYNRGGNRSCNCNSSGNSDDFSCT